MLCRWCYNVVATNLVHAAESKYEPPPPGKAGARGQDVKRGVSVYWADNSTFTDFGQFDSQEGIPVRAYELLLQVCSRMCGTVLLTACAVSARTVRCYGGLSQARDTGSE